MPISIYHLLGTCPSLFVTVPPSDLHHHIGGLLESQVGTDIMFLVSKETFAAHWLVLAARSPVFMAQLFGQMKAKTTSHVGIDDIELRVLRAKLHIVYTDSLLDMDSSGDTPVVAQHLVVAADKYGMERLKLICEDFVTTLTLAWPRLHWSLRSSMASES